MSDLIRREDAVSRISDLLMIELQGKRLPTWNEVYYAINDIIPFAGPEQPSADMETLKEIAINESKNGKVFDWDKAAKIIKERKPETAYAGLAEDWFWTGGTIYKNGRPVKDNYTYLFSTWATPVLRIDDDEIKCYQPKGYHGWDEDTKWPESALKILNSKDDE